MAKGIYAPKEVFEEILEYNPGLDKRLNKITCLVKKFHEQRIFQIVKNKIRVNFFILLLGKPSLLHL